MTLKELKQKIEENGYKEAKDYEKLFDTNLYEVVRALKKVDPHLRLNSMAYVFGEYGSNRNALQDVFVVYSITSKNKTSEIALGRFSLEERELEDFLVRAQDASVLSSVNINLIKPSSIAFEFQDKKTISFKTIAINSKTHTSHLSLNVKEANDALWQIVEQNYANLLKEEQSKVVSNISERKGPTKETKKAIKQQKANRGRTERVADICQKFSKETKKGNKDAKSSLDNEQGFYGKGNRKTHALKSKTNELKPKTAIKDLESVFVKKK